MTEWINANKQVPKIKPSQLRTKNLKADNHFATIKEVSSLIQKRGNIHGSVEILK